VGVQSSGSQTPGVSRHARLLARESLRRRAQAVGPLTRSPAVPKGQGTPGPVKTGNASDARLARMTVTIEDLGEDAAREEEEGDATMPSPEDAFEAVIREKVAEAIATAGAHREAATQHAGELRTLLTEAAIRVEERFTQAERASGDRRSRTLQMAHRKDGDREVYILAWTGPGPGRDLRVLINVQHPRLAWHWYVPDREPGPEREVPETDYGTFDPKPHILALIEPGPWLAGRFPD
jgi:hypothetical protein